MPRCVCSLLACLLFAGAARGRAGETEAPGGVVEARIAIGRSERLRLIAPGENIPYGCSLGMPYRRGTVLRFDGATRHGVVRIDGGAPQPAWIRFDADDGPALLEKALRDGATGFAVLCQAKKLDALPPLPRGRDISLAVYGTVEDLAALKRQTGITGLKLYSKGLTNLGELAAFRDLSALALYGSSEVSDLGPLARLPKLVCLDIRGHRNVKDLSPLAGLPRLTGVTLMGCDGVADLGPLAQVRHLQVLKLYRCEGVTDWAPLAKLTGLKVLWLRSTAIADLGPLASLENVAELDISYSKLVTDLTPLAELRRLARVTLYGLEHVQDLSPLKAAIRRGAQVSVSDPLKPQLERLSQTDF